MFPLFRSSPSKTEWVNVEKRNKRRQVSSSNNKEILGIKPRLDENRDNRTKSGKRLMKPAVVTITNKPVALSMRKF